MTPSNPTLATNVPAERTQMSLEGKRALVAAIRRIVFTGLILLSAWLLLLWLRAHIPESLIKLMNADVNGARRPGDPFLDLSYDSSTWDWTRSIWSDEPVSKVLGTRLPFTLRFIGLTGLVSLGIPSVLLLIGGLSIG